MDSSAAVGFPLPPPPEGFSDAPTPPPPPGFENRGEAPPPPAGFSESPPPPEGFKEDNPLAPQKVPATSASPDESVPGFWQSVGSAFSRGVTQRAIDDVAGVQVLLPKGLGGKSLEEQYQEGTVNPETKDEIDSLLQKKVSQGWTDPKWWGAQIAHGTGSMVPGMGAALVGGALGGTPGGVAGFGGEAGLGTLVPAYKAARAAGLDEDAALSRALVDSGISASTAVAMGLAPQFAAFGWAERAAGQVAEALKAPVKEALVQLGVIQPSLATAGHAATVASHGEVPGLDDLATTYATGVGMGIVPVGTHAIIRGADMAAKKSVAEEPVPPATPEAVQEAFRAQEPPPPAGFREAPDSTPPADVTHLETELTSPEARIFFSPVRKAVEEKLPESASVDQVLATLKNAPGVKDEELLDLGLPQYLAGVDGKVNKKDLLAHIESEAVQLEEVAARDPLPSEYTAALNEELRTPQYSSWVAPGPHENYREFILKVPAKEKEELPQGWYVDQPGPDNYFWVFDDEGNQKAHGKTKEEAIKTALLDSGKAPKNFYSSHWEDPNVIGHIRTTDRVDRDGRRLLHIEEIQSDAHQEGRKVGYKTGEVNEDISALNQSYRRTRAELNLFQRYLESGLMSPREFRERSQTLRTILDSISERVNRQNKEDTAIPNLPFKTSWPELLVKRALRLAADEGYEGISWANGDQVGLRQNSREQLNGSREFYDKILPRLFAKWAKKLGMDGGSTRLEGASDLNEKLEDYPLQTREIMKKNYEKMGLLEGMKQDNGYITVNPAAGSRIRMGLPLYETSPEPKHTLSEAVTHGLPKMLAEKSKPILQAFHQIAKDMKISLPLHIEVGPRADRWRGQMQRINGQYEIRINTSRLRTTQDLYATLGHEIGHVVMYDKFANADANVKTQVFEAFRRFREDMTQNAQTVGDVRRVRDNAISEMTGGRNRALKGSKYARENQVPLSDLDPRSRAYFLHFEEWFAEQVSKWATTSEKPLSRLEKFFHNLAVRIRKIVQVFTRTRGESGQAVKVMQDWLDSMISDMAPFASDIKDKLDLDTKRLNQEAMERDGTPEVSVPPQTASTVGGRNILDNLPPGARDAGRAGAAHADRMNRFRAWMTSLPQIAEANRHIRPLQIYKEIVSLMNLEKNQIMSEADQTRRAWSVHDRNATKRDALRSFIDDYANGMFKDPSDTSGEIRRPTQQEFAALVSKHKLGNDSLAIFNKVVKDFDSFLEKYRTLLLADAARIKDPLAQLNAIKSANDRVDELLKRPFMPIRRFGKYTITVYDTNGNIRHFEQTDSLAKQKKIAAALEKSTELLPGDRVRTGEVPKDAAPLLGMPAGLIDLIADKLNLSNSQRLVLDQLRFDYAPSQSFKSQFRQRDLTPGYSKDFMRAYAHFFFHGANHITRIKWVDALRDQVREIKRGSIDLNDAVKRDKIANYLTEHLNMLVDPKPDFAALRGLMFHWYLGFNPASATLNLSQTPIMTYPHLASKFGDIRAVGAVLRAGGELSNFYKKGTLQELAKGAPSGPRGAKIRAFAEAVKEGVISETQAHTLAAVSEDRNLLRAFGSKGEEFWQRFGEASSWMFEMTEQYNRRVAFRAAWDLAMRDPNNRYVQEAVRNNPLQYKRLIDQGWTHQEASAFTAAKESVEKTQFVYAPYARPKFMWGRKGALFIFKSFVQNTLWNLWANKSAGARSVLILGALGGMMGLPGMEDVNGILKALAWKLFGKDFDLEDEARKFVVDVLNGVIGPDTLLHGMSVHGFGIPQVMNALGAQVGLEKFFPTLDRHTSIGMGNILPFEPGKFFGPAKDIKANELQQLQRASGAGFSNLFALYEFLNSQDDLASLKRWEKIMPRSMSNLSHAWRYLKEGKETNRSGNAVIRFDPHDTEQMAEVLAKALGYQPRRLSAAWEAIAAKQEAATYWDLRRGILLRQFGAAVKEQNQEERQRVLEAIRAYNQQLPKEWKPKAITSQALKDSLTDRLRTQKKQEAGLPLAKSNIKGFQSMDKYFPEGRPTGQVDAREVK